MHDALKDWFRSRGGTFDEEGPVGFGDPRREYEAARSGAALIYRAGSGCLVLTGTDRLDLLHRTTTGDLKTLAPGRIAGTVIQTETARILDHLTLLALPEALLALPGPGRSEPDAAWIDRMTIMDDVQIMDCSEETEQFNMTGPGAADAVDGIVEGAAGLDEAAHCGTWSGGQGLIVGRTGPSDFLVLVSTERVVAVLEQLVEQAGVTPAGCLAAESLRLERGIPLVGRELTEAANPLEAGLRDSIGFEKGCYTGQEVIARMITYKSVKRVLCGFRLAGEIDPPERGLSFDVVKEESTIGRLTSSAWSFGLDQWIGLGYVKKENAPEGSGGTDVTIQTMSGSIGAVTALPPFRPLPGNHRDLR